MIADKKTYLRHWAELYRSDLVNNIMPFWLEHGLDRVNGGVYTCLDRKGTLMDPTKSVWFQGRFAFICAHAYCEVEQRPEYLEAARLTLEFIEKHCFDERGRMYFEVMADGTPLRMRRYMFSESFAAIAMAEYARATGDKHWADRALEIFLSMRRFMDDPAMLPPKYLPAQECQGHSITMIFINVALRLKKVIDHPELDAQIDKSIDALRRYFIHPEYKALLETVGPNGEFIDTCGGRTINPGHCIETAWFLLDVAAHRGGDKAVEDLALQIFDWSWQWGWDEQYGGIINFRDCKGFPNQDYSQDMKFWWPQCETIIATLYAYLTTGEERYLEQHRRISEWPYGHFPDHEYGEWYGYLHRDGTVAQDAKGNIFKGPFHIPRLMITGYNLCQRLLEKEGK